MYARRSRAGAIAITKPPSGTTTVASPPLAGTTFSAPLESMKYTEVESTDHCTGTVPRALSVTSCLSPGVGVGRTDGVGDGVGAGGAWVTKVNIWGAASC